MFSNINHYFQCLLKDSENFRNELTSSSVYSGMNKRLKLHNKNIAHIRDNF